MAKIFVIMGKSATGKDSVYKRLLEISELKLKKVVIYTTRPIRSGEVNGEEYFFVDEETLNKFKSDHKIIENRLYNTTLGPWHYFTVDDGQINLDESNYLIIGTLESYIAIKRYVGEKDVVPIYLEVDDGIRLRRALYREETQGNPQYSEMCRRYLADAKDFSHKKINEAGISKVYKNDDIELCIDEIKKDIKAKE